VCLNFRLKVVEPVQKCPHVSFEGPACFGLFDHFHEVLKWELLEDLAYVDCVVVIDEGL